MIGSPSEEDLMFIGSEKARRYIRSLPRHEHVDYRQLYPNANELVRAPFPKTSPFPRQPPAFAPLPSLGALN